MLSLQQIYQVLNANQLASLLSAKALQSSVTGFVIDSRQVQPNNVFCAFVGQQVDGHDYIHQALKKGASLIIATKEIESAGPKIIVVVDVLQALQQLATFWRYQLVNTTLVALTGSSGKTTIKNFLYSVLSQQGYCVATQGNQNNEIGVSLTLLSIPQAAKYAILELGARQLGDIAFLTAMVKPQIAFIANIGHAHIGIFGSKQHLVETKAEIFSTLGLEGTALLDADSNYATEFLQKLPVHTQVLWLKHQPLTLNTMPSSLDKGAKNHLIWDWKQGQSTFVTSQGQFAIKLKLLGKHNAHNAAWAVLLAQHLQLDLVQIKQGLHLVESEIGRLSVSSYRPQHVPLNKLHLTILNDSYNANPESTRQALIVMSEFSGKKIMVFADMLELGKHSENYHLELVQPIINGGIEQLFLLGKHCCSIHDYLKQELNLPTLTHHWYPDLLQLQQGLLTYLTELAEMGYCRATLLFKGSNGMQLSRIVKIIENL